MANALTTHSPHAIDTLAKNILALNLGTYQSGDINLAIPRLHDLVTELYEAKQGAFPPLFVTDFIKVFMTTPSSHVNDSFKLVQDTHIKQIKMNVTIPLKPAKAIGDVDNLGNDLPSAKALIAWLQSSVDLAVENGEWSQAIAPKPGTSAFPTHRQPTAPTARTTNIKCFNCNGNHHQRDCLTKIDKARVKANRDAFTSNRNNRTTFAPTPAAGNPGRSTPSTNIESSSRQHANRRAERRNKFKAPQPGESKSRVIDGAPYNWNGSTRRWDKIETPSSGANMAANIAANATPIPAPPADMDHQELASLRAYVAQMQQNLGTLMERL
jgi:hypothetical protein